MNAALLIDEAANAGINLYLDGQRLRWKASTPPPGALLEKLKAAKADIIAHLRHRAYPNLRDRDLLAKVDHLDRLIATKPDGPVKTWTWWRRHFQEALESRRAAA